MICISGCSKKNDKGANAKIVNDFSPSSKSINDTITTTEPTATSETTEEPTTEQASTKEENSDTDTTANVIQHDGVVVVIDPGHQLYGDSNQEPIGPGASETKARVTSGTSGVSTGTPEYQVNLDVAMKLKSVLEARGYIVIMTRESNDVSISNKERAMVANSNMADVFVRLHCNGSTDQSINGILALCPTANNPYCSQIYLNSRSLSDCILASMCSTTGAKSLGVSETDTMSGINWCTVPVSIIEMGFMSNPNEDTLLNDSSYQDTLANSIADGIDTYINSAN